MTTLQWMPDLDTGIKEIDVQHRRIFEYINTLHELLETHDRAQLGEVIAETVDYTISHFAFEEALMESAGYMFSGPHKRVHDLFTRRVAEMQKRFNAGEDVTEELHDLLSRWLFNHIRNEDHGYIEAVQAYMDERNRLQAKAEALDEQGRGRIDQIRQTRKKGWLTRLLGR